MLQIEFCLNNTIKCYTGLEWQYKTYALTFNRFSKQSKISGYIKVSEYALFD